MIPEVIEKPMEEVIEKPLAESSVLEEYDEKLANAETASKLHQPQTFPETKLHEAKEKVLAKHFQKLSAGEAEEKPVPDTPTKSRVATKDRARDPRIRRSITAPTGGA
jgi:hypothetical protein